jgi:predicted metal-dependent peptidase
MFGDQILPPEVLYVVDWIKSTGTPRTMLGHTITSYQNRWKRQGNNYCVPINSIATEQYQGKVYNVSTEDHTYTVSNAIVHNCDFAINLEIKDMGYALPDGLLLDQKYRDMCAEQIFDSLKDQDTSKMQTMDTHIENSDENNWDDMEDRIITAYEMTKNQKGRGNTPGGLKRWIDKLRKSKVKWERIFHRFVGNAVSKDDYSYTRVNKRFLGQDIYLPDMRSPIIGSIIVAVDTSGSMGKEAISQVAGEIQKLSHLVSDITAISCDCKIHEVVKIRQFDDWIKKLHFKGQGGTSFRPVFEYIKEKRLSPEVLIWLSDGFGDADWGSATKPPYPVLWCLFGENAPIPTFGQHVNIPSEPGGGW